MSSVTASEGWADSIHRLLEYYFIPGVKKPVFDYSEIRPKGAKIAKRFITPDLTSAYGTR